MNAPKVSSTARNVVDAEIEKYREEKINALNSELMKLANKRWEEEYLPNLQSQAKDVILKYMQEDLNNEILKISAMWLMVFFESSDMTPEMAINMFKYFFARREEQLQFYNSSGASGIDADVAIKELKERGVDIVKLNEEFGQELIHLNFKNDDDPNSTPELDDVPEGTISIREMIRKRKEENRNV